MIIDIILDWIRETVEEMGAEFVVFSPPSAPTIAIINQIPKLLQEGILDQNGKFSRQIFILKYDHFFRKLCEELEVNPFFFLN